MNSIAFSCIVDRPPYLMAQTYVWVKCLLDIRKVRPESIFVHATGIADPEFLPWLESLGVQVVRVAPFDPRSPHCNKICQLDTFADAKFDQVVLMDCDTAFVGDAPIPRGEPVAGKIVDNARPPESVLAGVFKAAGLGEPNWVEVSLPKGDDQRRSDCNNLNGGLYILDGGLVAKLNPVWRKWATWCLDNRDSFAQFARGPIARPSGNPADGSMAFPRVEGRPLVPVDQVSCALALRELGVSTRQLSIEWNYPTYSAALPDVTPQILHYSRHFDPPFKLHKTGIARPDRAIDDLNARIGAFLASDSARWVAKPAKSSWTRQVLGFLRSGSSPTSIQ
jgi:hypothetical protein